VAEINALQLPYCPLLIIVKLICFPSNFLLCSFECFHWWQCGSRVRIFVIFKRFRLVDIGQTGRRVIQK